MAVLSYKDDPNKYRNTTNNVTGYKDDPNKNKQTTNTLVPDTEIKPSTFVQMWTGQGYASVNPDSVQKKLADGWSMNGPSQGQMNELVDIAKQGGQGVYVDGLIKALEGNMTKSTPTSTTTSTYTPVAGYQTIQAQDGYNNLRPQLQPLASSITNQSNPNVNMNTTNTQPSIQQPTDNSNLITQQFNQSKDILVNQLKQKIAESKAQQEGIIRNAPGQFDPLRSQSELAKGQQLRSVLERNSLMGDRGGVGRSAALQTQTSGENRLNSINLQQQGVIDNANQQIANLESQGRFEEANIVATQKLAELQALMQESQRRDEIARQDALRMDDRTYNEKIRADELARNTLDQQKQSELDTLSRYSGNYQSEINRRQQTTDTADDWLIPYLETARQEKISVGNLDPKTGRPLQTGPTQDQWDTAYKKWNSDLPLTQQEMQILNVSTSLRPKSNSGGSGGGRSTTITQDRNYQEDRWQRLGTADEQVAATWGVPVGTPYSPQGSTQEVSVKPYQDYVETAFASTDEITGRTTYNRQGIAKYIYDLLLGGAISEADQLARIYGISEQEVETIERSMGNRR